MLTWAVKEDFMALMQACTTTSVAHPLMADHRLAPIVGACSMTSGECCSVDTMDFRALVVTHLADMMGFTTSVVDGPDIAIEVHSMTLMECHSEESHSVDAVHSMTSLSDYAMGTIIWVVMREEFQDMTTLAAHITITLENQAARRMESGRPCLMKWKKLNERYHMFGACSN